MLFSGNRKIRKASSHGNGSNPDSDGEEAVDKMTISEWQEDDKVHDWSSEPSYVQIKGHMTDDIVVGIQAAKDDPESPVTSQQDPAKTLYSITESATKKEATSQSQIKKLEDMADKMMKLAQQFRNGVAELKSTVKQEKMSSLRNKDHSLLNAHLESHLNYDGREEVLPVHVVNTVETVGLQPTSDVTENKKVRANKTATLENIEP